jgi:glycosyltransferase involved in cell wall biosynthesis
VKIVHVIARLNVGGAALSVLELAAGQQELGHDVLVVAGTIPPGEASMESVADELGVPNIHLPELTRELSLRSDSAAIWRLRSLLRARRPDVLHTHTSKAGATGRVAALLAGGPRAVRVHSFHGHVLSGYFDPRRERAFRVVERGLAHATDGIIAVSDQVRDDLLRFHVAPVEKITVVRYGFALDRRVAPAAAARESKRAAIGASEHDFVIGWAGRLAEIKRPGDLVRVAAQVPASILVLAGDGDLRAQVGALAEENGISDRVHILGYVEDMGAWYGAFDAFLLTSANEGAPVVAIEALAAGIPVVATDAGGTKNVVDDAESGFLAPVGDVDRLAERLRELQTDPGLRSRLGATGAERMRERFSTRRMVDDVGLLYDRLLARR